MSVTASVPEAALVAAALEAAMRWDQKLRDESRSEHWRYLDPADRIVAVVIEDDGIFVPVYEGSISLGQYATLLGAQSIVEAWHRKNVKGSYDAVEQARSVIDFQDKKRLVSMPEIPDPEDNAT